MYKKITYLILFLIYVVLYFALLYTGLESGDYMMYSYKFSLTPQEGVPWPLIHEKVTSFKDIVDSQYVHYLLVNGRSLVHTIIQTFTSFVRYDVCCLIATFVYALTLMLAVKVCFRCENFTSEPLFVFVIAVFAFCCDPSAIYYYMVTAVNYLWPITICLLFIMMLQKNLNVGTKCLFFMVAIISGWSHEAIAIPMSATFLFYLLYERKRILPYQVLGILLLFAGTAITVFAPGNFVKLMGARQTPNLIIFIKQHLYLFVYLRLFYVLILACAYLAYRHQLKGIITKYQYWFIALAASFFFIILTGTLNPRSTFFIDIISGGILCKLIYDHSTTASRAYLSAILSIVIIPLYISAIHYRSIIKERRLAIENTIATSNDNIVNVDNDSIDVPYIIRPYAGTSRQVLKQIHKDWNNAVYQFVYQKDKVNIRYIDSE